MAQSRRRVCLLTGASGTLGRRVCERFRAEYDIAAVHFRHDLAVSTQSRVFLDPLDPGASLDDNTYPAFAIKSDLTQDSELQRVVELVLARFAKVDVLINAAGCCISRMIVTDAQLMESADLQFRLNTLVPLKLTKLLLDGFWRTRSDDNARANRNVINVSSIAGVDIFADNGYVAYGSSKAALNFMTCSLAKELGSFGLRVNAIAPNSFPSIVPVDKVVDALQRIDGGSTSAKILVLDKGMEVEREYSYRQ